MPYLFKTIGLFIRQLDALVLKKQQDENVEFNLLNIDLEVDTNRLSEDEKDNLEDNSVQLRILCSKILRSIYSSTDSIPPYMTILILTLVL